MILCFICPSVELESTYVRGRDNLSFSRCTGSFCCGRSTLAAKKFSSIVGLRKCSHSTRSAPGVGWICGEQGEKMVFRRLAGAEG